MNEVVGKYNEIVSHEDPSVDNFIASLKHNDISLIFSQFLISLGKNNIAYKLVKSYKYSGDDSTDSFDEIIIESNEKRIKEIIDLEGLLDMKTNTDGHVIIRLSNNVKID